MGDNYESKETEFDKAFNKLYPNTLDYLKSRIGIEFIDESLSSQFLLYYNNLTALRIFKDIPVHIIPNTKSLHEYSPYFFPYHWDSYDYLERSIFECLSTYYGISFSLLRIGYDMNIRGLFMYYLTIKKYRDNACILIKSNKKKYESLCNAIKNSKSDEHFPLGLYDDINLDKFQFNMSDILKQLVKWEVTQPIDNFEILYRPFKELSGYVHTHPDKSDYFYFMINQETPFVRVIIQERMHEFNKAFKEVIDILIVLVTNLISVFITNNPKNEIFMNENQKMLETMGFINSSNCINKIVNI